MQVLTQLGKSGLYNKARF